MIRVLYAEDDEQVAAMLRVYFERGAKDCTLDVVTSGRLCLDAMQKGGYDVLLVDLGMPDIDGLQVLGELTARRDPTPVIMVSGHGQVELAVRALRAGAVDCIDKGSPEFLRLPEIVRRVHERSHQQHRVGAAPVRDYRILFLDSDPDEGREAEEFFAAKASRLHVTAAPPESLYSFIGGESQFDAIVLGPNLAVAPMLDMVRRLNARLGGVPIVVVSARNDGETAIAAFQLGAHDYLLRRAGWMTELVFSLNHAFKQVDTERLNSHLADELAVLNHSLAEQVAERTRDLEAQITVRKAAERRAEENAARLQALSNQLLRVQEDERRALALELHDQVGQMLTGLRFQLEAAQVLKSDNALSEALTTTDDLLRSVRALTLQLRPRMLDDLGLQPALEWQTALFGRQTGVAVDLEASLPPRRYSPELEITVFRVVQEALTNVARHSGATSAIVTATADDKSLHVEVSDRGRGFDAPAALARRDSLGLAGLGERVRLAGGRLEIISKSGQGTRLHAEFNLAPAAPALTPT